MKWIFSYLLIEPKPVENKDPATESDNLRHGALAILSLLSDFVTWFVGYFLLKYQLSRVEEYEPEKLPTLEAAWPFLNALLFGIYIYKAQLYLELFTPIPNIRKVGTTVYILYFLSIPAFLILLNSTKRDLALSDVFEVLSGLISEGPLIYITAIFSVPYIISAMFRTFHGFESLERQLEMK